MTRSGYVVQCVCTMCRVGQCDVYVQANVVCSRAHRDCKLSMSVEDITETNSQHRRIVW